MGDSKLEGAVDESLEKSFDDAELQDIMNEIESLEKEFVEDSENSDEDGLALTEPSKNSLQDVIDQEVMQMESVDSSEAIADNSVESETLMEAGESVDEADEDIAAEMAKEPLADISELGDLSEDPVAETITDEPGFDAESEGVSSQQSNVVQLQTTSNTTVGSTLEGAAMEFSANGTMNLSLNFQVGGSTATLTVDHEAGLKIEMNGVKLLINEESGCSMTMPSGVSFNIPLTGEGASSTKKAA